MPETKTEKLFFLAMMGIVMTIGMETYNLLFIRASLTHIFRAAVIDFPLMLGTVMTVQCFVAGPAAGKIAALLLPDGASELRQTFTRSSCTVLLMCPLMSLAATLYFKRALGDLSTVWLVTCLCNLPMAYLWQMLIAGPLVRRTFRHCFRQS